MAGMYNTDSLQTFLGAVQGVRDDQQKQEDNRMRLMQLDSQLATDKAERDLLPKRLELESTKLEFEMDLEKFNQNIKIGDFFNTVANSVAARRKSNAEANETEQLTPGRRQYLEYQTQIEGVKAFYQEFMSAHELYKGLVYDSLQGLQILGEIGTKIASDNTRYDESVAVADKTIAERGAALVAAVTEPADPKNPTGVSKSKSNLPGDVYGTLYGNGKLPADGSTHLSLLKRIGVETWSRFDDGTGNNNMPKDDVAFGTAAKGSATSMSARMILKKANSETSFQGLQDAKASYKRASERMASTVRSLQGNPNVADGTIARLEALMFNSDPLADKEAQGIANGLDSTGALLGWYYDAKQQASGVISFAATTGDKRDFLFTDKANSQTGMSAMYTISDAILPPNTVSATDLRSLIDANRNREEAQSVLEYNKEQTILLSKLRGSMLNAADVGMLYSSTAGIVGPNGQPMSFGQAIQAVAGPAVAMHMNRNSIVNNGGLPPGTTFPAPGPGNANDVVPVSQPAAAPQDPAVTQQSPDPGQTGPMVGSTPQAPVSIPKPGEKFRKSYVNKFGVNNFDDTWLGLKGRYTQGPDIQSNSFETPDGVKLIPYQYEDWDKVGPDEKFISYNYRTGNIKTSSGRELKRKSSR